MLSACLIATVVAGCGDDTEPTTDEPATTAEAEPTPDPTDTVTALWDDYWAAVVPAENDLNTDPAQFDGIMTAAAAEQETGYIQELADADLFRAGEPVTQEPSITVDGETALLQGCVDHGGWALGSKAGVAVQPLFPPGFRPFVLEVARQDDGDWLISRTLYDQEATITCEAS